MLTNHVVSFEQLAPEVISGYTVILTTVAGQASWRQFTVLSVHSFAINWQLLFLNQHKRKNGFSNIFMTKSSSKNVPDVGVNLSVACIPSGLATLPTKLPRQVKALHQV